MKSLLALFTFILCIGSYATERNCTDRDIPHYFDFMRPEIDARDKQVVWYFMGTKAYERYKEMKYRQFEYEGHTIKTNDKDEYCQKFVVKERDCGIYECYKKDIR